MKIVTCKSVLVPVLTLVLLTACSREPEAVATTEVADVSSGNGQEIASPKPEDAIARVGDQYITFTEVNTMMNSSPVVGLSMPALGTPERDAVRLTLLDKMISANLLYLDALQQGVDQDPGYQRDLKAFSDNILAGLYRAQRTGGNIEVSDEEIQEFYTTSIMPGTEFTDELRAGIEATIRKNKFKARTTAMHGELREGVNIVLHEQELDPAGDEARAESAVLASIDDEVITWGDVSIDLLKPVNARSLEDRRMALDKIIDHRIMIRRARETGLQQHPTYLARVNEYRKTRLINVHRTALLQGMDPSEQEIRAYFAENSDRISQPEVRDVQLVVVKTQEEAEALKRQIEAGETTLSKAAFEHTIVEEHRQNLGKIGWVSRGSGFPELEALTFSLGPDEVGGPVESPAGWNLVKVLDVRAAKHTDIDNGATQQLTRRLMLDEMLDQYVIALRKDKFQVEVYDDVISKLAQQEVDWFHDVASKKELSPQQVKEQIEKLRR